MKRIVLIISILLTGCASTKQIIDVPKVRASSEVIAECPAFVNPNGKSFQDFIDSVVLNKEVYILCNNLNKAKKEFIESNY